MNYICIMKIKGIQIEDLLTVKNYAAKQKVTPVYIYKLKDAGKLEVIIIDGVLFVDISQYPQLPTRNK